MTQLLFRTLADGETPLQRAASGPLWAAATLVAFVVSAVRDCLAALSGPRPSRPNEEVDPWH